MSKKHIKLLEAFMISEIKSQAQTALQTNYNKDGKIQSYSVVLLQYDQFPMRIKASPWMVIINFHTMKCLVK